MYKKIISTALVLTGLITTGFSQTIDVYVAGTESGKSVVWKNGEIIYFSDITVSSEANSMYVFKGDVYVAGTENKQAVVWKNGEIIYLTTNSIEAIANSVYVSNSDVYVAGTVDSRAVVWKNGEIIYLTFGSQWGIGAAVANSVYVSDGIVYVAGNEINIERISVAVVWEIGETTSRYYVPHDYYDTFANSVYVSGGDVYIAGREFNSDGCTATLWKNDQAIYLTNGSTSSVAGSVYLSGGDIYVSGSEYNSDGYSIATLWKNGEIIYHANDSTDKMANSVYVAGNDVYVAITEGPYTARSTYYMKNDENVPLSNNGSAYSIFVVTGGVGIPKIQTDFPLKLIQRKGEIELQPDAGSFESGAVNVYSTDGKLIYTKPVQRNTGIIIPTHSFPNGTYVIHLIDERTKKTWSRKVVI